MHMDLDLHLDVDLHLDLGWIWDGSGVDLGWIWGGSGVDLGWIWDPVRDPAFARLKSKIPILRRSRLGSNGFGRDSQRTHSGPFFNLH